MNTQSSLCPNRVTIHVDPDLQDLAVEYVKKRKLELTQVKQLISDGIFEEIEKIGHRMRGNAAIFGLHSLGEDAVLLELFSQHQSANQVSEVSTRMLAYLEEIQFSFGESPELATEISEADKI